MSEVREITVLNAMAVNVVTPFFTKWDDCVLTLTADKKKRQQFIDKGVCCAFLAATMS
jgi:hypothetical protein